MNPIIQVAGIIDLEEAEMVCAAGANYLGFPLRLKDGREDLSEEAAREVIRKIGSKAKSLAITYLDAAEEVIELCDYLGVSGVQLHGAISNGELAKIRAQRSELFVIKSLVVRSDNLPDLELAVGEFHPHVDAFITDTFDPATGRSGATGMAHDWGISRRLVEISPKPVILAGGLTADNVRQAIREVQPAGVDAHTGLECADGRKDPALVNRFVDEARGEFLRSQSDS